MPGFRSHLGTRIALRHDGEALKHFTGQLAIPAWFARDAAESVGGVSPDPGDRVVERAREHGDRPLVGNMIEYLNAPPSHLRVGIGDSLAEGGERSVSKHCPTQLGGGNSTRKGAHGRKALFLNGESLDELTLHIVEARHRDSFAVVLSSAAHSSPLEHRFSAGVQEVGRALDAEAEQVPEPTAFAIDRDDLWMIRSARPTPMPPERSKVRLLIATHTRWPNMGVRVSRLNP